MGKRIHLFGASGSGTTTVARAVSERIGAPMFDTDNYFWFWDGVPFTKIRPREERLSMLRADLESENWVLSGALCGWGDPVIPRFTLAVFVYTPPEIRLARLEARERARFGERILKGGDMYEQHLKFMEWASKYDTAGLEMRSLAEHEAWIPGLPCPCLRLDGGEPLEACVERVLRCLEDRGDETP